MKLPQLNTLFGGREDQTYAECRKCGLNVELDHEMCPACSCESIVRYEIK